MTGLTPARSSPGASVVNAIYAVNLSSEILFSDPPKSFSLCTLFSTTLRRLAVSATRIAHTVNRLPIHCVVNGLHGSVAPCTSAPHPSDHMVHEQKYRRRPSNARANTHGKK
ncbi:hypothetical protein [Burkholderia cenocepacia]|uniref:hypothetical protein n=1 Tax=Burkholderia cenocepacia TaxID=95486 RepID=UPI001589C8E8|nr:hypothetical protein [Burkholderia cenocepacia]